MSPRRAGTRGLRSAADSVLLHDMKNVGQRLNLLLSNLDEHYGNPDFKRSVSDRAINLTRTGRKAGKADAAGNYTWLTGETRTPSR